mmetsp:Transcript_18761/g.34802  ORF Transcript_18761/g.34802 Transcript_18761/m.34802 type:complete len:279 (+) Transcript_18761:661-1497(+)
MAPKHVCSCHVNEMSPVISPTRRLATTSDRKRSCLENFAFPTRATSSPRQAATNMSIHDPLYQMAQAPAELPIRKITFDHQGYNTLDDLSSAFLIESVASRHARRLNNSFSESSMTQNASLLLAPRKSTPSSESPAKFVKKKRPTPSEAKSRISLASSCLSIAMNSLPDSRIRCSCSCASRLISSGRGSLDATLVTDDVLEAKEARRTVTFSMWSRRKKLYPRRILNMLVVAALPFLPGACTKAVRGRRNSSTAALPVSPSAVLDMTSPSTQMGAPAE